MLIVYVSKHIITLLETIWICRIILRLLLRLDRGRILLFILFLGRSRGLSRPSIEVIENIIRIVVIVLELMANVTLARLAFIIKGLLLRNRLLHLRAFEHLVLLQCRVLSKRIRSHFIRLIEIVEIT